MVLRVAAAWLCCASWAATEGEIVWEDTGDSHRIVRSRMYSDMAMAEFIMAREAGPVTHPKPFELRQYFTAGGSGCAFEGRGFHILPATWKAWHDMCRQGKFQLAEVFDWRGFTVVRMRSAGSVSVTPLRGKDPRIFEEGGDRVTIEHFAFPRCADCRLQAVHVYALASRELQRSELAYWCGILHRVREALPFPRVEIQLANDMLFPDEDYFPWMAPFSDERALDLKLLARERRTLVCSSENKRWRCEFWGSPPVSVL